MYKARQFLSKRALLDLYYADIEHVLYDLLY